jgi:putative endonuclease
MFFSKKQVTSTRIGGQLDQQRQQVTKQVGDAAESAVLAHLQAQGLQLVQRNYRTPGRGGGEIDLILRENSGTLVFVEVRQRTRLSYGGAAASVSATKRRRIIFAARLFLTRYGSAPPPCRFDVVAVEGTLRPETVGGKEQKVGVRIEWIRAAFAADT